MENFVKRLINEHKYLTEKRNELNNFINSKDSNKVSKKELLLLGAQLVTLDNYINILENRLFEHDVEAKDGLYKKIITIADILGNDSENQPSDNSDYAGVESKNII